MNLALVLLLDDTLTTEIKTIWDTLAAENLSTYHQKVGKVPHITLWGNFQERPLTEIIAQLQEVLVDGKQIPVTLTTPIIFPQTDTLIMKPQDSTPIVALHEKISACTTLVQPESWPYVPHLTIMNHQGFADTQQAQQLITAQNSSFVGQGIAVGLIAVQADEDVLLAVFPLQEA